MNITENGPGLHYGYVADTEQSTDSSDSSDLSDSSTSSTSSTASTASTSSSNLEIQEAARILVTLKDSP